MKKISSSETFSYRIDSLTVVEISPAGTLVTDEQAKFIQNRLGSHVSVEDVNVETEVEKIIEETVEETVSEETTTEEAPVVEETVSEETTTEEAPKANRGGRNKTK